MLHEKHTAPTLLRQKQEKTTKNNNLMNAQNFSNETIAKAAEAIKLASEELKNIKNECAAQKPEEAAQTILMQKFGDAQIEAEEIVGDMMKGMAEFDTQMAANAASDSTGVARQMAEATKDMTDEQRHNCYANVLAALQLAANGDIAEEDIEERQEANAALTDEQLLEAIEQAADARIELGQLAAGMKDSLSATHIAQLAREAEMRKDECRLMAALALYIGQRDGTVSFGDTPLSALHIGALAAAGTEAIIATGELEEGKTTLAKWQKAMKYILGALIGIALSATVIGLTIAAGLGVVGAVWDLLGVGLFATFVAIMAGSYIMADITEHGFAAVGAALGWLDEFYDNHIAAICSKLRAWARTARQWAKAAAESTKAAAANACSKVAATIGKTNADTSNDTRNTQKEQPADTQDEPAAAVQPAMA